MKIFEKTAISALGGPLVMLTGYLLLAFVPVLVRVANRAGWETPSTVFTRFVIACICIGAVSLGARQPLRTGNPKVLFLRGLLGGAAVICYFAAVELTSASTAVLLSFTNSIWANVLAVVVLGQRPFKGFWPLLALAAVGLFLVIDPDLDTFRKGEMLGLLSGILGGGAVLCVKQLRKSDNSTTIQASLSVGGLLCVLPLFAYSRMVSETSLLSDFSTTLGSIQNAPGGPLTSPALGAWLAVLAMGLCAYGGQHFFTSGYKNTSVQLGTLLSLTTPLWGTMMGRLLLEETLTARFLLGASFILLACLLVGLKESRKPGIESPPPTT